VIAPAHRGRGLSRAFPLLAEAIYAKVLVAETGLLRPRARNLTEKTRAFFRLLFPRKRLQRA